jgi:hypothetical protein
MVIVCVNLPGDLAGDKFRDELRHLIGIPSNAVGLKDLKYLGERAIAVEQTRHAVFLRSQLKEFSNRWVVRDEGRLPANLATRENDLRINREARRFGR